MARPSYIRHIKIRSEQLRAMLHEAWKLGNESTEIHEQPAGEVERRGDVLKIMLKAGLAEMKE